MCAKVFTYGTWFKKSCAQVGSSALACHLHPLSTGLCCSEEFDEALAWLLHSVRAVKVKNKEDFFNAIVTQNGYLSYEQVEQVDESPLVGCNVVCADQIKK